MTTEDTTRSPLVVTVTALLFDMDGTLVDSTPVVERTWRSFAHRHGLDAERILAYAHGRRTEETVARFLPSGLDAAAEARRIIAGEVRDTDGVTAIPGAAELLAALPRTNWAVVTSAGRVLAEARMRAAGLRPPPTLVSADDVTAGKPDPEGYLTAAGRLGVPPESTLAFEDADAGLRAARASGATTVMVGAAPAPAGAGLDRVRDLRDVRVDADHTTGRLHVNIMHY